MNRRFLSSSFGGLVLAAAALRGSGAQAEAPRPHRMAFHVGGGDPVMMNVALHNIAAAAEYYAARKETVAIELVANGPGYAMLRAERGISRRELADALGVHYQTVGYLERGEYSPSLYLALRIAAHFEVPVEVIFSTEQFPRLGTAATA